MESIFRNFDFRKLDWINLFGDFFLLLTVVLNVVCIVFGLVESRNCCRIVVV